ncbi:MAG: 1,4-alpha-glucan branching enzyme GlgB [Actinomycetota bacterium]
MSGGVSTTITTFPEDLTAMLRRLASALGLVLLSLLPTLAYAAGADNNVEWNGLSHYPWQERRPICPVNGESFQVRFQTYRNDLTAAEVRLTVGATVTTIAASRIGTRGPYDLWAAQIPATTPTTVLSYWIRLVDGTSTAYLSRNGITATVPADGGYSINFATLEHAPPGATLVNGGAAVFKVWAPNVAQAFVRGAFNAWGQLAMTKYGEWFIARGNNVTDRSEYKFFFPTRTDNGGYAPDPVARAFNAGAGYNSIVENPFRFTWTDSTWQTPPLERMVIYQMHVGTFAGLNDPVGATPYPSRFQDVTARVAHLKSLGVNAVQLCPITEYAGDISAGYNPVTFFAPEGKYGTPDQFKQMVNTLHNNGIAVLLDIVWNHVSPSDNYLWNYDGTQSWFYTPDASTPWGSQPAFERPAISEMLAYASHLWLGEYRLDGFRMDGTAFMKVGPNSDDGWFLMQRMNNEKNQRFVDRVTIAENLPSEALVSAPTSVSGAGFDSQYSMMFRERVRGATFAAAFGDPSMNDLRLALLGDGYYLQQQRALHYVQLHDEAWPSSGGQRIVKTIDGSAPHDDIWARGRSMLALGTTLTSMGVPAFLQGDEWMESNPFNPAPDNSGRLDWSKKTSPVGAGAFGFYSRLIKLRTTLSPLFANASTHVFHVNEGGNVIGWRRTDGNGNTIVILANWSNTDYGSYTVGMPQNGAWTELVNSQNPAYGGSGPVNSGTLLANGSPYDGFNQSVTIALPKMTFTVLAPLSFVGVEPPTPGPAPAELSLSAPWPNPSREHSVLRFALPQAGRVRMTVHDVTGRLVRVVEDRTFEVGSHATAWNGRDEAGALSPSGLYFVRLETPTGARSTRLVRL